MTFEQDNFGYSLRDFILCIFLQLDLEKEKRDLMVMEDANLHMKIEKIFYFSSIVI